MKAAKDCFGILDRVFPMTVNGLREVKPACFECPEKTDCLKAALKSRDGLIFQDKLLNRNPAEGVRGRIKRWSQRKELSRRLAAQERSEK